MHNPCPSLENCWPYSVYQIINNPSSNSRAPGLGINVIKASRGASHWSAWSASTSWPNSLKSNRRCVCLIINKLRKRRSEFAHMRITSWTKKETAQHGAVKWGRESDRGHTAWAGKACGGERWPGGFGGGEGRTSEKGRAVRSLLECRRRRTKFASSGTVCLGRPLCPGFANSSDRTRCSLFF
jgi:hypothetical protein